VKIERHTSESQMTIGSASALIFLQAERQRPRKNLRASEKGLE